MTVRARSEERIALLLFNLLRHRFLFGTSFLRLSLNSDSEGESSPLLSVRQGVSEWVAWLLRAEFSPLSSVPEAAREVKCNPRSNNVLPIPIYDKRHSKVECVTACAFERDKRLSRLSVLTKVSELSF